MGREINPIYAIAAIVALVAVVVAGFLYFAAPRAPGGVKYTPGVPPWMEKGGAGRKQTPDYPPAARSGPPMAPPAVSGH